MAFGPFSTLPIGLPSFFGLTGQAMPKAMEENINASIDIWQVLAGNAKERLQYYASGVASAGLVTLTSDGTGSGTPLGPQNGEAWFVRGFAALIITANAPGADRFRGHAVMANYTSTYAPLMTGDIVDTIMPSSGQAQVLFGLNGPFWMFPGDRLGVWLDTYQSSGGAITVSSWAHVYRFKF